MIFDQTSVIEAIKSHDKVVDWIIEARKNHAVLKALVHGDGFKDLLIDKIEGLESGQRSEARKKYAKDIRDLFHRVFKTRSNVFEANGGSESVKVTNENILKEFIRVTSNFKSNKSIFKYLSEYYFDLVDTDPNGLIFLEYKTLPELKLYPTYKAIKDIRYYEPNGQLCEYVVLEPEKKEDSKTTIWRVIDDLNDWTVIENSGVYIIDNQKTFQHPFGKVPALILSDVEKIGTNERLSPINPIVELAKDYARDKSILTIYKFLQGFPIHWKYITQCRACAGLGKKGEAVCTSCNGKGYMNKGDVTDVITLAQPKQGQDKLTPDIAGFISPDLKTWDQYSESLKMSENKMYDTIWGTDKMQEAQKDEKTATGEYLDIQPITNTLNRFTDNIEYIDNTLSAWALNFVDPVKARDEKLFSKSYGRRYILESPDTILEKYQNAKKTNDNNTILDKLMEEFILSKYKSDPHSQDKMIKKFRCEPYPHNSVTEINLLYGDGEALKKILFQKFWETADLDQPTEKLIELFNQYFKNESSEVLSSSVEALNRRQKGEVQPAGSK